LRWYATSRGRKSTRNKIPVRKMEGPHDRPLEVCNVLNAAWDSRRASSTS
jgi:hypothetical protein